MEFLRFNSSKFRTFAPVFIEHESFYCSISDTNLHLETRFYEHIYILLELRFIAQTSIHRYIGAVQGLCQSMDWACAFFIPHFDRARFSHR